MINWVTKSRLLGMTVDGKLTWLLHVLQLKKTFANKLTLLKKSKFLPRSVRIDLYFKVILRLIDLYMVSFYGDRAVTAKYFSLWNDSIVEQRQLGLFSTFLMIWSQTKYLNEHNGETCILVTNLQFSLSISTKRIKKNYQLRLSN